MKIIELLISTREDKNFTQEEMGEEMGVAKKKLSRWEMGDFNPNLSELRILSNYFDMEIAEIVEENKPKEEIPELLLNFEEDLDISETIISLLIFISLSIFTEILINIIRRNYFFLILSIIVILLLFLYINFYIESSDIDLDEEEE